LIDGEAVVCDENALAVGSAPRISAASNFVKLVEGSCS
jgi:hypothetical protein